MFSFLDPLWIHKSISMFSFFEPLWIQESNKNLSAGKNSQSGEKIPCHCDFGEKLESLMLLSIH